MITVDAKKVIAELVENLKWCSGSADFGPGGQAFEGWKKGPALGISQGERVVKAMPDGVMVEIEQTEAEKEEERAYFETHPPAPIAAAPPNPLGTLGSALLPSEPEEPTA